MNADPADESRNPSQSRQEPPPRPDSPPAIDGPHTGSKKIIVDEDWKAQAQAEKESLQHGAEQKKPKAAAGPLPPPSLELLATTLGMQAMLFLGLMPHPVSGKAEVDLEQAKHFIDTLQMLQEKTAGNRTAQESAALEHLLHELRLAFLAVQEKSSLASPEAPTA